jgi:hypothetical protein
LNPTPKEGATPLPCPAGSPPWSGPSPAPPEYLEELLDEWDAELAQEHRGLELRLVAGGYQ